MSGRLWGVLRFEGGAGVGAIQDWGWSCLSLGDPDLVWGTLMFVPHCLQRTVLPRAASGTLSTFRQVRLGHIMRIVRSDIRNLRSGEGYRWKQGVG